MIEERADTDFDKEFNETKIAQIKYQDSVNYTLEQIFEMTEDIPFNIREHLSAYLDDLTQIFIERYVY